MVERSTTVALSVLVALVAALLAMSNDTRAHISHAKSLLLSLLGNTKTQRETHDDLASERSYLGIATVATDRVNNGRKTSPEKYPFFAQMWFDGRPQGCGGSLIASKWILTAAHCVDGGVVDRIEESGYPEWRVGSYCDQIDNCGAKNQTIRSKKGVLHPQYDSVIPKWDFALLELTDHAAATPVHIDDDGGVHNALQSGSPVRGIGMGYINDQREFSSHLLEVDNLFLPLDSCRRVYQTGKDFDDSVMCTNGADYGMCVGDSGSPVLVIDPQSPHGYSQVSVTSFGGPRCENHNFPDGSARISTAIDWIKESVCPSYGPSERDILPHFCEQTTCSDEGQFFLHFKKNKLRSCKKIKGKKVEKLCQNKRTNANEKCPVACGRCP